MPMNTILVIISLLLLLIITGLVIIDENKKKIMAIISVIIASILHGYLFFASLILGYIASRYGAGKKEGEKGKFKSVIIPVGGNKKFHVHHWLYAFIFLGISSIASVYFLNPEITYGLFSGLVFHGIYCYKDWHKVVKKDK